MELLKLSALGELNVFNNYHPGLSSLNPINLKIAPPIPWVDPTSSAMAVSLLSDFSDRQP